MSFRSLFITHDWEQVSIQIYNKTADDVLFAIRKKTKRDLNDFMALLSPAAAPFLEEMAMASQQLTRRRFGHIVQLYVPLYLSNSCYNTCTYCGFSRDNKIPRKVLTKEEIRDEIEVIKSMGFDHVLICTGEDHKQVGLPYFLDVLPLFREYFSLISIETQPMEAADYCLLCEAGVNTVYLYQETYHQQHYANYHLAGKKQDFFFRLEGPERLGAAGMHKIGLACLLGLEDWRVDSWFVALHVQYLEQRFWQSKYSISFPRLRPAVGFDRPNYPISDKELVQLICAYRLLNEHVELSLSTREPANFRDHVAGLGITSMSAGSKTEPYGYSHPSKELEQFMVDDDRSPAEVVQALQQRGIEAVWKDWDSQMS